MSDVNLAFRRAILAFTYADEFVSAFDQGHLLAEDIAERMAGEQDLGGASLEKQMAIQEEIRAAISIFEKFVPGVFIMQMSLFEDRLFEICEQVAHERKLTFERPPLGYFKAEQAKALFEQIGVKFPASWPVFEKVTGFQKLKDDWLDACGRPTIIDQYPDLFLFDVDKALLQFFQELEACLPENIA